MERLRRIIWKCVGEILLYAVNFALMKTGVNVSNILFEYGGHVVEFDLQ